ncbi:MAG: hypothetical protein GXX83_02455 [Gaiellales bacterium]|nr:hypothetical protein [Gaiellales bacterium]
MPPALVAVSIAEEGRTTFRMLFPLFLLWPLLLVLLLIMLLVLLVVDAVRLAVAERYSYTRLLWAGLKVVGETRGTEVSVRGNTRTVGLAVR